MERVLASDECTGHLLYVWVLLGMKTNLQVWNIPTNFTTATLESHGRQGNSRGRLISPHLKVSPFIDSTSYHSTTHQWGDSRLVCHMAQDLSPTL